MKLPGRVYLEVQVREYSNIRIFECLHTQVSAMIITGACGCDRLPPSLRDALRTASLLLACLRKAPLRACRILRGNVRCAWGDRLTHDAVGEIFRYISGQKTQCKEKH